MDKNEIKKRIETEEDYVRCPKLGNSLKRFLAKNHQGVENKTIARLLMIPEEQVEQIYNQAVETIKEGMDE